MAGRDAYGSGARQHGEAERRLQPVDLAIEGDGDHLTDLHVWRLGPGHLGAIVSVATASGRDAKFYRERLAQFRALSHLTVEVERHG